MQIIVPRALATGKLPVQHVISADKITATDEYISLSKLYVLAKKLMDQITKGLALTAISARAKDHVEAAFHKTYQFPALDCIQVIYKGTVKGNPARCLLAQLYTDFGDSTFLTAKADIVPKDFLYDLSLSMLGSRPLLRDHEKVLQEHKTPETDKMRLKDELRAARASLIDYLPFIYLNSVKDLLKELKTQLQQRHVARK
ncbi:hypothetical protein E8E11_006562 [Didymella keratinophila]|nr:hypothetical protein E8E11_006562 [Didymella keratinophila]